MEFMDMEIISVGLSLTNSYIYGQLESHTPIEMELYGHKTLAILTMDNWWLIIDLDGIQCPFKTHQLQVATWTHIMYTWEHL
jgi:hypothetical protein